MSGLNLTPTPQGEWQKTPGGVEYRKACAGEWGWGAWTNGAYIFKRHVLEAEV